MEKLDKKLLEDENSIPSFGYHLIRNVLLQKILGEEYESLLYWSGKSLAREYPLSSLDEFADFFTKAGWGILSLTKEGRQEWVFQLEGIERSLIEASSFRLEAGFLAEQVQNQKGFITEAIETKKKNKVIFEVKWDRSDKLHEENAG